MPDALLLLELFKGLSLKGPPGARRAPLPRCPAWQPDFGSPLPPSKLPRPTHPRSSKPRSLKAETARLRKRSGAMFAFWRHGRGSALQAPPLSDPAPFLSRLFLDPPLPRLGGRPTWSLSDFVPVSRRAPPLPVPCGLQPRTIWAEGPGTEGRERPSLVSGWECASVIPSASLNHSHCCP